MFKLDHLVLRVSDFQKAVRFYQPLFQFLKWSEVLDDNAEKSLGFRDSAGLTIWLGEVENLQAGARCGFLDHFAFHCDSRKKVDVAYSYCLSQNWKILSEPKAYPQYGNFYGFSFEGPDGLKLEFVTR